MGCSGSTSNVATPPAAESPTNPKNLRERFKETPTDTTAEEAPIVVGTQCVPPPGGRQGRTLNAGPATNLKGVTGIDMQGGLVERRQVTLMGGATYIGQWKDVERHGKGKLVWPDGLVYEGDFVKNMAKGKGKMTDVNGDVYEGEFLDNRINGAGMYRHKDGSTYNGQWVDDIKHGKGLEVWKDGTVYEGNFNQGNKEGKGKVTFPNRSTYEGYFLKDNLHGQGRYTWPDGCKYDGQWDNGLMHGRGVFKWPSGQFEKYDGQYFEGVKQGDGKLYFRDQRIYEGPFRRNRQHGFGIERWPGGLKRRGEWRDGKLYKWVDKKHEDINLGEIPDDTDDQNKEYEITAFSNPNKYHENFRHKSKHGIILNEGIMKTKTTTANPTSNAQDDLASLGTYSERSEDKKDMKRMSTVQVIVDKVVRGKSTVPPKKDPSDCTVSDL